MRLRPSPAAAHAGHRGIVWLHLSAVAAWLLMAAVLGVIAAVGRPVPAVVLVVSVAAAAGHGVFSLVHLFLARAARSTDRATSEWELPLGAHHQMWATASTPGVAASVAKE